MAPLARPRRSRQMLLHGCRVAIFAAILLLIHSQATQRAVRQASGALPAIELSQVQMFFAQATSLGEVSTNEGLEVLDAAGDVLGYYLQTSPSGDQFIGFSGPTNVLIALDASNRILGLAILSSGDTKEHIRQVVEDEYFLQAFDGLTQREAGELIEADAVTGATLTSLAIHEAVIHRLGGNRRSLRFPKAPALEEIQALFPDALAIEQDTQLQARLRVLGPDCKGLGYVLRTSPAADNLVGYQGPTETLVGFGIDGHVIGISLRASFDNESYVTYVRDDGYFLKLFNGYSLAELAKLDLLAAEVEGVSGATMTSMTVARGIVLAAGELASVQQQQARKQLIRWSLRDLGTAATILLGCLIGLTSLRSVRWLRVGFQILLVVYLGWMHGDMVSLAMISGWAQHGIPWRSAGSLLLLTLAAFLVPMTTRRNIYCTHLCPHGAAQQLLKNRLGWRLKIPPRVVKLLRLVPGLLLAWAIVVVVGSLPMSLVDIEPFDAWVFRIAGWATITIAIVGLVASLFVPMAYCRYSCPTGALLGFLRLNSRSDRWSRRDWMAVFLLVLSWGLGTIK